MPIIKGGPGDDYIPRGSTTIDGGGNVSYDVDDTIYGFGGNDVISGSGGRNLVFGGIGNDGLIAGGVGLGDTLYGGKGNDGLSGNWGDDILYGDAGDDFIWMYNNTGTVGQWGMDRAYGGAGNDYVVVELRGLTDGSAAYGGAGTDKLEIRIENLYDVNNMLVTTGFDIDLRAVWTGGVGTVGGSTVRGFEVINSINGGAGNDHIVIGTAYKFSGNELVNGVLAQNLISGNGGDDYISGGSGIEQMNGGVGNDTLISNGGDDYSAGAAGNDLLYGGAGNDSLSGDAGDDTLYGGAGNDAMFGSDGNDVLDGGTGNNYMDGGTGDDTYYVNGTGDDVRDYSGIDTVISSISYALNVWPVNGVIENLILTGSAALDGTGSALANRLTGNAGANHLYGMENNDTIFGGAGNDTISGGQGVDVLGGGSGADTFVFDVLETSAHRDRINGFVHGTDKIAFDHTVFAAFSGDSTGPLAPSAFGIGTSATTLSQHIIYDDQTGRLLYDEDGKGGVAAIVVAVLNGAPTLDASDILLM